MTTSLVTGGAGFIGSHVSRELLKLGHNVVILDDLSGGFLENIPQKTTFIEGSITNEKLIQEIFEQYKFDYVYHLAAYAAEILSHFIRNFNYTTNLLGSINLINAAVKHKIKCFVFTSSIGVYGAGQLPLKEDTIPIPEDPYGISKLAVEQDLKAAHKLFDLNYVIFRPHNVYGEYQNIGDKYRNVVGIFMNQLMSGKPLTIFGDGEQTRAFSYIGDIAPHIAGAVLIPKAYEKVFNIGADKIYTVNELSRAVITAMGLKGEIKYVEARDEVKHAYSDHAKLKEIFNYQTTYSLEEGLAKMTDWAKKTGIKESKKFKNIEISEKIPPVWLND